MYRHKDCGGELHKFKTTGIYICDRCKEPVEFGRFMGSFSRPYYGIPKEEIHVSLHSLVSNGGKVLVVGGSMNPNWATYVKHPQVLFWTGEQKEIRRKLHDNSLPDNVRAVIISRFISHADSSKVIEEARKRRALILGVLNDGEITRKLDEIFTVDTVVHREVPVETPTPPKPTPMAVIPAPERLIAGKGQIKEFIKQNYQPGKPNIDEARRLLELATKAGIQTTEGSLAQGIYAFKKQAGIIGPRATSNKFGRTGVKEVVVSIPPNPAPVAVIPIEKPIRIPSVNVKDDQSAETLVELIDEATKALENATVGLKLVREQVIEFGNKSQDYINLKSKMEKLLRGEL